jgi:hypothetical protein
MDDYTIEILEEEEIIRVHTTFDTSAEERRSIKGISYCSYGSRYSFDAKKGDLFSYEDVVKNIEAHFENRFNKNFGIIDFPKKVSIDLSKKIPLGPIDVFKDKEDKEEKEKWSKYLTKLNREAKEL